MNKQLNILVTTMGGSWQILPELLGFTNPELVDLFKNHSGIQEICQARKQYHIEPAHELWVISSCGEKSLESINKMLEWYDYITDVDMPALRIWKIKGTDDLSSAEECRIMSEAVHTIVMNAAAKSGQGRLMLSLTGGRKTMSTDLQQAAAWFGCSSLIHIVDNSALAKRFNTVNWGMEKFSRPLPEKLADTFTPFCLGSVAPNPLAELNPEEYRCDLFIPEDRKPYLYEVNKTLSLTEKIKKAKSEAGFLLSNYTSTILQGETITNFLALYSLPPHVITKLKNWKFGLDPEKEQEELTILHKLPKAELHCHLGGIADAQELIRIAGSARQDVEKYAKNLSPYIEKWKKLALTENSKLIMEAIGSFKSIRKAAANVPDALCTAAFILIFENNPKLLHNLIYSGFNDSEKFCGIGFSTYERIGDLQGSGLLTHKKCLETACRIIAEKAARHNVDYLEIRCSPVKYSNKHQSEHEVYTTIAETFAEYDNKIKISLIFTASRHGEKNQILRHVELAKKIVLDTGLTENSSLCGFDLAGDEKVCSAGEMHQYFLPLMKECMHFTIHAGENNPVKSIWEAVYKLNAQRIGHGLTLKDNPALMKKFLDSNIAIEMCPSSNFQIVGFRDNYLASTVNREIYPLKQYLSDGLCVTVNTDNPGISDTDFTKEIHRACRLTPTGLSLWEILSIIRNGFKASFAQRSLKYNLLKKAENRIVQLLREILSQKNVEI